MSSAKAKTKTADIHQSEIFSKLIIKNHKRLFISLLSILVISNASAIGLLVTGSASKHLTWNSILMEFLGLLITISLTFVLTQKLKGRPVSAYIAITGTLASFFIFQYIIFGSTEIFVVHFILLALSVFYFDAKVPLYAMVMVFVSQVALFNIRPELIPAGPRSGIAIRMIVYIIVGLAAALGARSSRELLMLAIQKADDAENNFNGLQKIAHAVEDSVTSLKEESKTQERMVTEIHDRTQTQASSLEEISAAIEELSGNSESITSTAKSLIEEVRITSESIDDLKKVYEKIDTGSAVILKTIEEVQSYSGESFGQMKETIERFRTLEARGKDMANFIQVINEIADKVNLLSLNASIEAARAGEHGRGFAVVANEVSKLADATASNSREIEKLISENKDLIAGSSESLDRSRELLERLNASIANITREINEVSGLVSDIGNTVKIITNLNKRIFDTTQNTEMSTKEQQVATIESSRTILQVSEAAQEVVQFAVRISESSKQINRLSEELTGFVREMLA